MGRPWLESGSNALWSFGFCAFGYGIGFECSLVYLELVDKEAGN